MNDDKEYYSASRRGFFPGKYRDQYESSANGWPDDAIEITKEYKDQLFEMQAAGGYEIQSNKNGYPVAVEWSVSTEDSRRILIDEADAVIRPMLGYAAAGILSDTEKETFKAWNKYRKALEDVDVTAADIEWPAKPE